MWGAYDFVRPMMDELQLSRLSVDGHLPRWVSSSATADGLPGQPRGLPARSKSSAGQCEGGCRGGVGVSATTVG